MTKETLSGIGFVIRLLTVFLAANIITWFIAFFLLSPVHRFIPMILTHAVVSLFSFGLFAGLVYAFPSLHDFVEGEDNNSL